MATLNLFPSRIPFVDSNGCLTPEAYRALQVVLTRLGGAFGDQGIDTFALFSTGDHELNSIIPEVIAGTETQYMATIDLQPIDQVLQAEMIMQGDS